MGPGSGTVFASASAGAFPAFALAAGLDVRDIFFIANRDLIESVGRACAADATPQPHRQPGGGVCRERLEVEPGFGSVVAEHARRRIALDDCNDGAAPLLLVIRRCASPTGAYGTLCPCALPQQELTRERLGRRRRQQNFTSVVR